MANCADLEIGIHRRDLGRYGVELRLSLPESDADQRRDSGPEPLSWDLGGLKALESDPGAYGRSLCDDLLFASASVRAGFAEAYGAAQSQGLTLRVRLFIGPDASELHGLRWETLTDPLSGTPLATREHVLFSRYLSSTDWRAVRLRRKSELRALAAIASPAGIAGDTLAKVDAAAELERVRRALRTIELRTLAPGTHTTQNAIVDELGRGYDLFYLVCHGRLKDGEPRLLLEDEEGNAAIVSGAELASRIAELERCPRLAVLASCQGAGSGDGAAALAALGPRLVQAGVPAVLAMQGDISLETVECLVPDLLRALDDPQGSGEIDRALAVARANLRGRGRPDWWAPALYMRLKSGRIWYVPGFAGDHSEFDQWRSICGFVRDGQVVPIVGPDIAEHVIGPLQDLAAELAEANRFPFAVSEHRDLAKVAQFIVTKSSLKSAREQVDKALRQRLDRALKARTAPGEEHPSGPLLDRLLPRLLADPKDPLRILTELKARVYVSASANPILERALALRGRAPRALVSHWRDERDAREDALRASPDPTPEAPYVHYIFGDLREPDTWVLTEDDYFDYLIRTSRYHDLIPEVIGKALTASSLVFLGFRLDDWRFRILFRMILAKGGSAKLREFNHVGVQVSPDEHSLSDATRAKRYLERYFGETKIDLYWGSAADFLAELAEQLATLPTEEADSALASEIGQW